jgi:hypothetical protein
MAAANASYEARGNRQSTFGTNKPKDAFLAYREVHGSSNGQRLVFYSSSRVPVVVDEMEEAKGAVAALVVTRSMATSWVGPSPTASPSEEVEKGRCYLVLMMSMHRGKRGSCGGGGGGGGMGLVARRGRTRKTRSDGRRQEAVHWSSNMLRFGLKAEQSSERPLGPITSIVAALLAFCSVAFHGLVGASVNKNKSCGADKNEVAGAQLVGAPFWSTPTSQRPKLAPAVVVPDCGNEQSVLNDKPIGPDSCLQGYHRASCRCDAAGRAKSKVLDGTLRSPRRLASSSSQRRREQRGRCHGSRRLFPSWLPPAVDRP